MKHSRLSFLGLNQVEERITEYETKYSMSSADFLTEGRDRIPEDAALRWEALIHQRRALRLHHETLRSSYLGEVKKPAEPVIVTDRDADLAA